MTPYRCGSLALVALLAAAPARAEQTAAAPSQPAAPRGTVAVLPFANLGGDASRDWIGDGIAASLINDLGRRLAPRLDVLPRQQVGAALGSGEAPVAVPRVQEIGRSLGARWVVSGSHAQRGGRIVITGRLIEVATGDVTRGSRVEGALAELFELQDRLASELVPGVPGGPLAAVPAGPMPRAAGPPAGGVEPLRPAAPPRPLPRPRRPAPVRASARASAWPARPPSTVRRRRRRPRSWRATSWDGRPCAPSGWRSGSASTAGWTSASTRPSRR